MRGDSAQPDAAPGAPRPSVRRWPGPASAGVIDAQVHVWEVDRPGRRWLPGADVGSHRQRPMGGAELLQEMAAAGVSGAVLVPPSWEGYRNDLALSVARRHPDRFAVMGRLDLQDPRSQVRVPQWRQQQGMLGVRLTFHRKRERQWLADGTAEWFWRAAQDADLPVMVYAPGNLPAIADVALRHPGLRLVIDHLGLDVTTPPDRVGELVAELLPLARRPNVAVKASGLPAHASDAYPFPSLVAPVRSVVEAFGAARVFWGTDLTRLPCSYSEAVTSMVEGLLELAAADREQIMGSGVAAWLKWNPSSVRAGETASPCSGHRGRPVPGSLS